MTSRFIDWIWHIRGSLTLAPGQSSDDAFKRLDSLFDEYGTHHERTDDRLTFRKKDQAAQDKMAVFDGGVLQIEQGAGGSVLHYHLTSRALLFCFLAPLLFLAFGQLTVVLGALEKPPTAAEKAADEKAEKEKEKAQAPMNPIDKALGAPEPEKPDARKDKDGKDKDKGKDKNSPTAAYVFAGIFATLYVVGRILEDRLVRSLFRKKLADA
ncbi:hypothetical protein WBP06_00390 [Novosphingobium sp. BL-8H]|uniref:hypothetical protein n=1 Tax=Novosphingobium sp. BL-8H TaxID=3127640 RepID=UPI00375813D7